MRRRITNLDLPGTIPPVEMFREFLDDHQLSRADLVKAGLTAAELKNLDGPDPRFDEALSAKLGKLFNMSPGFWARLDAGHQEAVAAGKPVISIEGLEKKASGKIALRIPSYLHARLQKLAKTEGISLNQLMSAFLAEGLGRAERGDSMPAKP